MWGVEVAWIQTAGIQGAPVAQKAGGCKEAKGRRWEPRDRQHSASLVGVFVRDARDAQCLRYRVGDGFWLGGFARWPGEHLTGGPTEAGSSHAGGPP